MRTPITQDHLPPGEIAIAGRRRHSTRRDRLLFAADRVWNCLVTGCPKVVRHACVTPTGAGCDKCVLKNNHDDTTHMFEVQWEPAWQLVESILWTRTPNRAH